VRRLAAQSARLGVPDPRWGEQVAAFVLPAADPPPAPADLEAFCAPRLARFKVPRHWVMVDAYPMTASGKIQKYLLRDAFDGASSGQRHGQGEDGEAEHPPGTAGDGELPAAQAHGTGGEADHRQGRDAERGGDEDGR